MAALLQQRYRRMSAAELTIGHFVGAHAEPGTRREKMVPAKQLMQHDAVGQPT